MEHLKGADRKAGRLMGYEERFKRYLNGELKGEEKEAIEEDMERLEVLLAFMDKKLDEGI